MSDNIFSRPDEEYVRELDPIGQYYDQSARFLATMTGNEQQKCRQFVEAVIKGKQVEGIRNPTVTFFERQPNGDREKRQLPLSHYIYSNIKSGDIIVPTFTCYLHPTKKPSLLVDYLDKNTKKRSIAKKAMFAAEANKNMELYTAKNNEQTNKKLKNNSVSGSFVAGGSILNNPSAHSTLTSITRNISSFGNASNERVIAGNRHYWSWDIALYNIISIVSNSDYVELQNALTEFGLAYPSVEDTMACLHYSSHLYWEDPKAMEKIRSYVLRLKPIERAAFVYTGDLYHIRKHNPEFMRDLITNLAIKTSDNPPEDPVGFMKKLDENTMSLAHAICSDEVRGFAKEYHKMPEEIIKTVAATAKNILTQVERYKSFVKAFFLTKNVPPSVAYIPHMQRRIVVLSDTDSTCFATDEWLEWYFGNTEFNARGFAVGGVVSFFATQCISHILAILSANINVDRMRLHTLAMKNEFTWSAMATTSVAKHYFALTAMQEGSVFDKIKPEIKGVHLKNSSSPSRIVNDAERMMVEVLTTVSQGKKIKLLDQLRHVASMERFITNSVLKGEVEFYRRSKVKEENAYKKGREESPYQHHILWQEVFEPKYGSLEPPPYSVVKIPTTLVNKTRVQQWLDNIQDRAFADRMAKWLARKGKTELKTFYIPVDYLLANGMIEEIRPIIDTRKISLDLTKVYRLVLEALGAYFKQDFLITEHGY